MKKSSVKVRKIEPLENTIVCRGKLILIWGDCRREEFHKYGLESHDTTQYAKPVIISETEEIQEGDYGFLDEGIGIKEISCRPIEKKHLKSANKYSLKVLALPETFSPQILKDIIDGRLEEGEVLIECEEKIEDLKIGDIIPYQIKFNQHNHITLFPFKKEESWDNVMNILSNPDVSWGTKEAMVRERYNPPTKK